MSKLKLDPRLGLIGGVDTKVCAITGKPVSSGMIRYSLGNGYYFRVFPSKQSMVTDDLKQELQALIPQSPTKTTTKAKSSEDKQS